MADDRRTGIPWLENFGREALDPGYAAAANRRGQPRERKRSRSAAVAWLAAAMIVAGVAIGVAVKSNQLTAPSAAKAQQGLLADIDKAQQREQDLESAASLLADQIRSRQQALGVAGPLQTVASLQVQGALTPVTGPGLQVVIDSGSGSNVILDRDVQLLVNGLWSSGAEAVSVGGVRLRTTSAIRQAGGAILVDNKPTSWPLTINAIGDAAAMQVAFAQTSGFARFSAFKSNYGIRFDITNASGLALPGGAAPELHYAVTGSAQPTNAPTTTGPTR